MGLTLIPRRPQTALTKSPLPLLAAILWVAAYLSPALLAAIAAVWLLFSGRRLFESGA